ncbi:MAG: hypothetical protein JWM91_1405 [Rhodospirillales bacterium]|nr:hypothetical protein [Rhodospirillales bacterium]
MTAYIVFTREKTLDKAELDTYSNNVGPALAGHPFTAHAFYGHHEVLEGPEVEGVVILSFPTFEAAKAWYDSPDYTAVRQHRLKGAEYRVVIVEGV